jgi:hypothetical protein
MCTRQPRLKPPRAVGGKLHSQRMTWRVSILPLWLADEFIGIAIGTLYSRSPAFGFACRGSVARELARRTLDNETLGFALPAPTPA